MTQGFEIKLPKQKEVMPIDMELVSKKKSEQKPSQKPKEFDEKINEKEGFAPQQKEDDTPPAPTPKPVKEVEKTPPAKPKEKSKPQPKPQPQTKQEIPKPQPQKPQPKKKFPTMQELSQAMQTQTKKEVAKEQEIERDFALKKLYGKELDSMGQAQKKFLSTNMGSIQSITQRHLNRMGYPRVAVMARQSGANIVEFVLHPNGDITDLKLLDASGYGSLDRHSISLIEVAYKDYPYPKEPTLVRIQVIYNAYAR